MLDGLRDLFLSALRGEEKADVLVRKWNAEIKAIQEIYDKARDGERISAEPERKKGEWILKPHEKMLAWDCEPFSYDETYNPDRHSVIEMLYHCPTCNYEVGDIKPIWKFCPMCGTDVREGEKNETD